MPVLKTLRIARIKLRFAPTCPPGIHAFSLRGAIAGLFPKEILLHQHSREGFVYHYPQVHYRWGNGTGLLLGVQEGAELLARLPLLGKHLRINGTDHEIIEAEVAFGEEAVGPSDRLERYTFRTPWLPFNQQNFRRLMSMTERERPQELQRIAIGNLLSLLKGLEYSYPERLFATFAQEQEVRCHYKGQVFVGFKGVLSANLILPEDLAIGKAVSHGFGWLGKG